MLLTQVFHLVPLSFLFFSFFLSFLLVKSNEKLHPFPWHDDETDEITRGKSKYKTRKHFLFLSCLGWSRVGLTYILSLDFGEKDRLHSTDSKACTLQILMYWICDVRDDLEPFILWLLSVFGVLIYSLSVLDLRSHPYYWIINSTPFPLSCITRWYMYLRVVGVFDQITQQWGLPYVHVAN